MAERAEPSLKSVAIRHLARREYTRTELGRKLAPRAASAEALQRVLDDLEASQLLSDRRFVETTVAARAARMGSGRVQHYLASKGVAPDVALQAVAGMKAGEPQVAYDLWSRRFGTPPATVAERARHWRFLLSRGFPADVARRVLQQAAQLPPKAEGTSSGAICRLED